MDSKNETVSNYTVGGKTFNRQEPWQITQPYKSLRNGTVVIVAGTTNGYVAEEILKAHDISNDFSRKHFFRGITLPPTKTVTAEGRLTDESKFPGDVVIVKGVWQKGKTIADVVDSLKEGDVILKGANALDLTHRQAAILIGHPKAGTIGLALPAIVGRRVKLIIPVGLEKRVNGDLNALAEKMNAPGAQWATVCCLSSAKCSLNWMP